MGIWASGQQDECILQDRHPYFFFVSLYSKKWPKRGTIMILFALLLKQAEGTYPDPETGTPCAWCISHSMRDLPSEEPVFDLCQKLSASPKDTQHRGQPVALPVSTTAKKLFNSTYNISSSKKPTLTSTSWAKIPNTCYRGSTERQYLNICFIFLLFSVQLKGIFADGFSTG